MTPTELLTTEQVAAQLGVEPVTLSKWRSTRKYPLAFVKIGGKVRYSAAEVQRFIEARTITPGESPRRKYTKKRGGK
jgi:excisionase family DNA binding protein